MTTSYAYIEGGLVREIIPPFIDNVNDPENPRNVPIEERYPADFVVRCVSIPENVEVAQGDSFVDGLFGPPPAPPAPTSEQVMAKRGSLLSFATLQIAPLQDLVDLGEADEDDEGKLLEWKQYRAAVGKVQTQPGFPASVVWPDQPAI